MEFTVDARHFDAAVIRWFASPALENAESTRRARALWIMAWPFFIVVMVVLGIAVAVEPATLARRAITIVAVGLLVALLHELNRRGRTVLASWIFVIGLTLIVTQRAWNTGGIHAPVAVFYTLFILMAGALLGARASLLTAIVCVVGAIFLTSAEQVGWLTAPIGARPAVSSLVFTVLTIGLALVLQNFLTRAPAATSEARLRDDLVQMVVHDMRSPITVLLAQLSMLREDSTAGLTSHVDEAIGGARTLSRLVANLLDVSRFEAQRMPIERTPTDVADVARHVVTSMRALEPDRDIEVTAGSAGTCSCDAELLRRILENLVSNAIKHTPATGKVRIHVTSMPGRVRIAVQDEGPGVPEETRRRVFEKFGATALRTERGYYSTGLGLAFCKLAVESHGGTIRVEDAVPHGSVFIVELTD